MAIHVDTNLTYDEKLYQLNKEKMVEFIPVIVYVAVVVFLGTIGNIMTVIFYGFRIKSSTTSTMFISYLAAIDLITCVVVADEIIELVLNIAFLNVALCKVLFFVNHWFVTSSVWVLWVICIDRYRKVCRTFEWQFTRFSVRVSVAVVIGIAFLHAIPSSLLRDVVRVNVTGHDGVTVQGYYCSESQSEDLRQTVTAMHILDMSLVVVACVTYVVLYSLIGRAIIISNRKTRAVIKHTTHNSTKPKDIVNESTSASTGEDNVTFNTLEIDGADHTRKDKNETTSVQTSTLSHGTHSTLSVSRETIHIEIKITLIMIAITVGYIVSFTPYFIINLAVKPNSDASTELEVGSQLALRSFLLNSAINPYIIGIFNPSFRQFAMSSICRCFRKKRHNDFDLHV